MNPINTSHYNIERKEDDSLVRVDGLGGETPEMDVAYYNSQIAFHEQVVANLEAQRDKLEEWLVDNPKQAEEMALRFEKLGGNKSELAQIVNDATAEETDS